MNYYRVRVAVSTKGFKTESYQGLIATELTGAKAEKMVKEKAIDVVKSACVLPMSQMKISYKITVFKKLTFHFALTI